MPTYFAVRTPVYKVTFKLFKKTLLSTIEFYVHVVKQNFVRLDLMGIIFCNFLYFLQFYFFKKSLWTEALLTTSLTAMKT